MRCVSSLSLWLMIPKINIRATNVELTNERRSLISRKLSPLSRFLVHEEDVAIDVVMRKVRAQFTGDTYYVSVKVNTANDAYIAVAHEHHLAKALTSARESLRRTISRGASVMEYGRRQRQAKESFTLTL